MGALRGAVADRVASDRLIDGRRREEEGRRPVSCVRSGGSSEVVLEEVAAAPLYQQLHDRLRAQITGGQLEAGARLPSSRVLATQLGVSRTTTALAYELRHLEGYVVSRVGDGTRVARLRPERWEARNADDRRLPDALGTPRPWLARRGQLLLDAPSPDASHPEHPRAATGVFHIGQPDLSHFPSQVWARLLAKHARRSLRTASYCQDARGCPQLREAIAAHVGVTRGVRCLPEQVLVTSGAQAALDLASRVLLDPGDAAWVEDPGYGGTRGALLAAGARLVAVLVDREGIEVEAGQAQCHEARLAVVTPSFKINTGVTMSRSRRLALLEWARLAQAWIVEDDWGGDYRFGGESLGTLQGLDPDSRVVYIGSFGTVLFPSVRLGYLVAPDSLLAAFLAARQYIDVHPPLLEQLALADFFAEGHFLRHLQRMRGEYLERRNALVDALRGELGDTVEVVPPEAGTHLVAWLPAGVDGRMVACAAVAMGLHIEPVSRYSTRPPARDGLLLGFASHCPQELRAGVVTLARALRTLTLAT